MKRRELGDGSRMFMFVVFGLLYMFSFPFVYSAAGEIGLETTFEEDPLQSYSVDSNWSEEALEIDNLETDSDILYPEANQDGYWLSPLQEEDNSRVVVVESDADNRDGVVNITVNAFEEVPENQEPDASETVEVGFGINEYELGLEQYNYFEVRIDMIEEEGNSNQRPNLDSFTVSFEYLEEDTVGLSSDDLRWLISYVYLSGFVLYILSMYKAINRGRYE